MAPPDKCRTHFDPLGTAEYVADGKMHSSRLSTKFTYDRFGIEVPEENSRLQDLDLYFDKNCRENLMTGSTFGHSDYEESQVDTIRRGNNLTTPFRTISYMYRLSVLVR